MKQVLVTGGSGYVGSRLVPKLLHSGYSVTTLDLFDGGLREENLLGLIGDIRNAETIHAAVGNCDAVIHLACLSNDPTADLNPELTKAINLDSFRPLVHASKSAGVKRFIYASSSSVYGVKNENEITEELSLQPLTDYSRYKAVCEEILLQEREPGFETIIVRPATICGYAPSMRLDLLVHIFTMAALRNGVINVHGGYQYRSNIHIDDMVDAYLALLEAPADKVDGEIFNCGYRNLTILETAELVADIIGGISVIVEASRDPRSYHVNSDKIKQSIGFEAKRTIESAVREIIEAYEDGKMPNPEDDKYYRVRQIKGLGLTV